MVKMVKTVEEVKALVQAIRTTAHDSEKAHMLEDDLFEGVLRTIAQGDGAEATLNAVELAKAALKSKHINFARMCA